MLGIGRISTFSTRKLTTLQKCFTKTFLTQAYYCNELWDKRLNSPILQKMNVDEFYYELEQRFQKTRQISAIDVDIYANSIKDNSCADEVLDLLHKLRLSSDASNVLESTGHAAVRILLNSDQKEDLLNALDDRVNYGLFLDYYTANLLLDTFWKQEDYVAGARVAAQLMLQEEADHPLTVALALIHCYKYLLKREPWPQVPEPEEPKEEVKVRVKYLRNPYYDNHFDLRDSEKIVGKTLVFLTKGKPDTINVSFNILGHAIFGDLEAAQNIIKASTDKNLVLCKEVLDLIPEENEIKKSLDGLKTESVKVEDVLIKNVKDAQNLTNDKDIEKITQTFPQWETNRLTALEEQNKRLDVMERLQNIEELQNKIKEKETKLWFFENEEQIELGIEGKKIYYKKRWFGKKKKPRKMDENYIPPEI